MASTTPRWARNFFDGVVAVYEGDECLLWPYAKVRGYAVLRVDGRLEYVCQLLAGPRPEGAEVVAHSCGRGSAGCVTRSHVRWTTQKDNIADTLLHGTRNRGTRNGQSKLTESDVMEIRRLYATGAYTYEELAIPLGVVKETVRDIVRRKIWAWLDAS